MLKNYGLKKGINFGGWFSQCKYEEEHFDTFITEKDFAEVKAWGADHIRLPIDYNIVKNEDGSVNEKNMARLDKVFELCRKYSLKAVLDLHKTAGFSFDSYSESEHGFFEDEAYQEYFYVVWETLAQRYGKLSDMVFFELLNEITEKEYIGTWNRIVRKCIKKIRVYAPNTYILVGSYLNNSAETVCELDAPFDEKVIYNMHCYEPLKFTHQGAYWTDKLNPKDRFSFDESGIDEEYFEKLFSTAIKKAEENNTGLYCGEYGMIDIVSPEDTLKWYKVINKVFEKYGIGRCAWTYKGLDFGLSESRLDGIRPELQKYL